MHKIEIGSRVRITEDIDKFPKDHEFTVYGCTDRGWDLIDSNGNKLDETRMISSKIELVKPTAAITKPDFTLVHLMIDNSRNDEVDYQCYFCETEEEADKWIKEKETERDKWNYDTPGAMSTRWYSFSKYNKETFASCIVEDLKGLKFSDLINILKYYE